MNRLYINKDWSTLRKLLFLNAANGGATPKTETLSGNIVTFRTTKAVPLIECKAEINPVQAGSGDPSPQNVRPITGWTGAKVTVSPTTDEADGTTYSITFPTEAGTVYGGSLDVTNGVLTVDRANVLMSAFDFSLVSSPDRHIFRATYSDVLPDIISHSNADTVYGDICDRYTYKAYTPITQNDNGKFSISPISADRLVIIDHRFSSTSDFQEAVNDVQLVYELATPITYQLTPQEITTLIGTNNVWADTGNITVTYYK